eukprot:jgi/Mesen1/5424/ME000027S04793
MGEETREPPEGSNSNLDALAVDAAADAPHVKDVDGGDDGDRRRHDDDDEDYEDDGDAPSAPEKKKVNVNIDWSTVNLDEIELPEGEDFGFHRRRCVPAALWLWGYQGWPLSDFLTFWKNALESETGFGNIVVVGNLPVVPPEKYEKLVTVVKKIFGQIGAIRESGLWMPAAREQTHGYKLDKSHVFHVCMFDDFDKYARVPDEYVPPVTKDYAPQEGPRRGALFSRGLPMRWSPLGTYLATMHRQGAAVWGGASWQRLMRFAHPQVRLIDFSPGEKFLVTYSSHEPTNPRESQKVTLDVFETRSGKLLRDFKGPADEFATGGAGGIAGVQWPDKYFARIGKGAISVYETETMGLLDKKSIKVDNLADFSWSPAEPLIAYFVPEAGGGNQPARKVVKLATLKGKQVNALLWSPQGRYIVLAGLKGFNGQLEFFSVDDMETMATGEHFMATDVEWDPTGRFVATAVTSVHQMENGYNVWSFNGKLLYRIPRDRFTQFLWRPRPPSLLPPEKDVEIAKNLRKYSKKYEVEDEEAGQALGVAEVERRRQMVDEWKRNLAAWKRMAEQERGIRESLRGGEASDDEEEYEAEEVEVEEIIDIQEEIMSYDVGGGD